MDRTNAQESLEVCVKKIVGDKVATVDAESWDVGVRSFYSFSAYGDFTPITVRSESLPLNADME